MMKKNFFDQKSRSSIFSNHGRRVGCQPLQMVAYATCSKYRSKTHQQFCLTLSGTAGHILTHQFLEQISLNTFQPTYKNFSA